MNVWADANRLRSCVSDGALSYHSVISLSNCYPSTLDGCVSLAMGDVQQDDLTNCPAATGLKGALPRWDIAR